MRKLLLLLTALCTLPTFAVYKMANVVCFVKFADQKDQKWEHDFDYYEKMFNDVTPGANSVINYFSDMSFGRMEWKSVIVRTEYVDQHSSSYYLEKSSSNPDGYTKMDLMLDTRMKELVKNLCAAIDPQLPAGTVTDADGDGIVDNLVIIICGNSDISASRMLWPANNVNSNTSVTLAGARVKNYLKVFDGANGYKLHVAQKINTGVLCHEMTHTLNAFDLYPRKNSTLNPIGVWDLMSDNGIVPQEMSAYTRMTYGNNFGEWISGTEVETLSEPGEYTLNPLSSPTPDKVVYKIVPNKTKSEYFLLEYRDKSSQWDKQLPYSGLLVYRVNPGYEGNGGADNKYELYVFRKNGSTTSGGSINNAPLGPETNRTSFGLADDDDWPFFEDGSRAYFSITDVKIADGKVSFRYNNGISAIEEIEIPETSKEDVIYTLQGIRLKRVTSPGIYIINGKKVVVK